MDASLEKAAELVEKARKIVAFTGAGVSTESGIPDFRSPGGIWEKYQPVYYDDFLASEASRREYWQRSRATSPLIRDARPNPTHLALCELEKAAEIVAPCCQSCGGLLKDATISFGQPMPVQAMSLAGQLAATCDLMILLGSSLVVYPAAYLPQQASQAGAALIIINLATTSFDDLAAVTIRAKTGEALPQIVAQVRRRREGCG
ncbi:MAG: Sir2 family NAD-dependent protein deacetylase [Syntrophales bacterium]